MSIITFLSEDSKETGQSMSISATAIAMAIEHNYRILLFSTDFLDKTLENCFWNINNRRSGLFSKANVMDVSNGLEGLVRTFASNRASSEVIRSYTKPVLKDRLDILQAPKTIDYKEYISISQYFSQIADTANQDYDVVMIDMGKNMPRESKNKILNISDLIVVNLLQNMNSINNFFKLKSENEFYRRNNVLLMLGKYNPGSKFSSKNVARLLKEKNLPMAVPYNILFADECSEGRIVDYILKANAMKEFDNKDTFFVNTLKNTKDYLIYKMQEKMNGLI